MTFVAPPGYGKSTCLALWRAKEPRPVGWVTVDAADADPIRFLNYMALAIERALRSRKPIVERIGGTAGSALSNAVPRLTSALHELGRPMVLMLDDVHHLGGTPSADVLAMVVDYLPRGITIAAAGRTDAGLPLARLRASGRLVEIGIGDLALDEAEAGRMAALGGRQLPPDEARDLHARTEGWPAAVYLAVLRAQARAAANGQSAAPTGVSGRDTDIGDYLDGELLDHATPRVRTFLTRTAVLDRMSADLCDAVVDGSGSERILRDLAATNQLVVPLDAQGGWFRYHTLLREHLLVMLERDRVVRGRAQPAGGGVVRGQRHARDGRRPPVRRQGSRRRRRAGLPHRSAAVPRGPRGDVRALARPARRRRPPPPAVPRRDGRVDVHDPGRRRRGGADDRPHDRFGVRRRAPDRRRGVRGGAGVGARVVRAGRAGRGARRGARRPSMPPSACSAWRPQSLAVLGAILVILGDREQGEAALAEAAASAQPLGAVRALVFADAWRALSAIERDDWSTADTLSRRSAATAARARFDPDAVAAVWSVVAARVADPPRRARRGAGARWRRSRWRAPRSGRRRGGSASAASSRARARTWRSRIPPARARASSRSRTSWSCARASAPSPTRPRELRERIRSLPPGPGGTSTLTPAEVRVLRLLPTYLTAAEMADRLYVTPNTVRTQIQALYGKLGATSRAEAVEAAIEIGLLEPLPVLAPGRITSS